MKTIRNIFKKVDVFGVPFSFKHKEDDKYTTSLGGFIFILFLIAVFVIGIYYFIPFYNRKNFQIIYYSMNMPTTDEIKLSESKANFAIGFDCPLESKTQLKGEDLLDLDLNYIIYTKDHSGAKKKDKFHLDSHYCRYDDFYNNYNDTMDFMSLNKFKCLDKKDNSLQGIYTDEVFSYYEFSVISKNENSETFQNIDKYLTEADCRLEIYYTDITIDYDNYEDPIQPYINSVFIQLDPTLFIKMNVYFMNQYFDNDNYLFFVFDEEDPIIHTLFSRTEEYALYKGLKRDENEPSDKNYYGKIYIRADTKKTYIKRKYQKVMEFYADSSSLLIALFDVLYIIFCFFNNVYAEHSLAKRIFFFKEAENNHFNLSKKSEQIKSLIYVTESLLEKNPATNNALRKNSPSGKEGRDVKNRNIKALEQEEIKIYNRNKNRYRKVEFQEKGGASEENEFVKQSMRDQRMLRRRNPKMNSMSRNYDYEDNEKNFQTNQQNTRRNIMSRHKLNLQPSSLETRRFSFAKGSEEYDEPNIAKVKFSYNIFEIIWTKFFCCCMTSNLRTKKNLTDKANAILNTKLDISLYVKNTILLDLMNQTMIEENIRGITKLISNPMISANKYTKREMDNFYKIYSEADFNLLSEEISEMALNPRINKSHQKVISLVNKKLKEMV